MKKSFLMLVIISLFISGCKVPFTQKEVYIPFLEKSPQTVINMAKAKLMSLDNYRYLTTIKIGLQSELSQASYKKVAAIGTIPDASRTRVLGIKVDNTASSSDSLQNQIDTAPESMPTGPMGGFDPTSILSGNKLGLKIEISSQGKVDKMDSELVSSVKLDFGNEAFSFDTESKTIGGQNYFKIVKTPALISGFIQDYLDKWLVLDQENWDKIESKYNDNFGQSGPPVSISNEQRQKAAGVAARISTRIKNGNLFVFESAYDDELVGGEKNYHYSFGINPDELSMLANEIASNTLADSGLEGKNPLSESIKANVIKLVNSFKGLKAEAWINQKSFNLQKIKIKNSFDLINIFKQEQMSGLPVVKANIDLDIETEFFVLNHIGPLVKPEQALPFSEVIEQKVFVPLALAKIKSRDAKRVADIKQIQTALEMFYNEANRYPLKLDFGVSTGTDEESKSFAKFIWELPTNPKPNDGSCPLDFEYSFRSVSDGQDYELVYCLGGDVGALKNGIGIANPEGMTKENVVQKGIGKDSQFLAPNELDTDGDGLSDEKETKMYYTDPNKADSDGDGYSDGAEVKAGYNPNGPGKL